MPANCARNKHVSTVLSKMHETPQKILFIWNIT